MNQSTEMSLQVSYLSEWKEILPNLVCFDSDFPASVFKSRSKTGVVREEVELPSRFAFHRPLSSAARHLSFRKKSISVSSLSAAPQWLWQWQKLGEHRTDRLSPKEEEEWRAAWWLWLWRRWWWWWWALKAILLSGRMLCQGIFLQKDWLPRCTFLSMGQLIDWMAFFSQPSSPQ